MGQAFVVENSVARSRGQFPEQKVLFKHQGRNVGELEMRNDRVRHYQQVRFNMNVPPAKVLLFNGISKQHAYSDRVWTYGEAIRTFGNW